MDKGFGTERERTTHVKFYLKSVKNNFKSKQENKNVFDSKEYVKIIIPGDSKTLVDRPVNDKDRQIDYPNLYGNFKKREKDLEIGTPVELLPSLREVDVDKLKAMNIYTLEHLIGIGETAIKKIDGCRQMMADAEKFIGGSALIDRLKKENEELKAKIKDLENEFVNNSSSSSDRDRTSGQPNDSNRQSADGGSKKSKPVK